MPERISLVGALSPPAEGRCPLSAEASLALEEADLLIGAPRLLEGLRAVPRRLGLSGDIESVLDTIAAEEGRVCLLASGDPGFFGILRPLAERFGPGAVEVHPSPSAVSVAFARLGLPWDDAVVVSAHGRPPGPAVARAAGARKAAVLVSSSFTASDLGAALVAAGARFSLVAVCSRLGASDEAVERTDLEGLAARCWDPLSVVVLVSDGGVGDQPSLAWGLPDSAFAHRAGMLTKSEVRAVALGKLDLPSQGVMWDVGSGSGSVAVECARLSPGMAVVAVEARPDDARRIRSNALRHRVTLEVVEGRAPAALHGLADPDRAFVGGGGPEVLDAVLERLAPAGRIVATFAALERASHAAERLGNLVEVGVSRGRRLPDGGLRLEAQNPVFIAWGPGGQEALPAEAEGSSPRGSPAP